MTVQRVYAKSENNKKIIIFDANLHSLRCRQRSRMMDGSRHLETIFLWGFAH